MTLDPQPLGVFAAPATYALLPDAASHADAVAAFGEGRYRAAVEALSGAIRLDPNNAAFYGNRSLARDHAHAPINLLISTSSGLIKGIRPPAGVPHLCYCHAPARYLWSATDQYTRGFAGRVRAAGFALFGPSLRAWDARTAGHVTRFVANSSFIRDRIREHFGREASVLQARSRRDLGVPAVSSSRSGLRSQQRARRLSTQSARRRSS